MKREGASPSALQEMTIGRRVKIVQEDSPYREGGMTAEQRV